MQFNADWNLIRHAPGYHYPRQSHCFGNKGKPLEETTAQAQITSESRYFNSQAALQLGLGLALGLRFATDTSAHALRLRAHTAACIMTAGASQVTGHRATAMHGERATNRIRDRVVEHGTGIPIGQRYVGAVSYTHLTLPTICSV